MSRSRVFQLGGGVDEVAAAVHLARVGVVWVEGVSGAAERSRLQHARFVPVVRRLECLVDLPLEANTRRRRWRRKLELSWSHWRGAGLAMEVDTVDDLGDQLALDELYVPLLMPWALGRGASPYGSQGPAGFLRVLRRSRLVARVRDLRGQVVGFALLAESKGPTDAAWLRGRAEGGAELEGLVYALDPRHSAARRALLWHLCEVGHRVGVERLSLGADLGWVELGYRGALEEKVRWADRIRVERTRGASWLGLPPAHPGLVVFEDRGAQGVGLIGTAPAADSMVDWLRSRMQGVR